MMKRLIKITASALLIVAMLCSFAVPCTVFAKEWWIMEATYTLLGREPMQSAGPQSRIFLPEMIAATADDGIDMEMTYEVTKDGDVFASGDYTVGTYVDLAGAGSYVFSIKGVDALNSYDFTVEATDENPSLIYDAVLPLSVNQDDIFVVPDAQIAFKGTIQEARVRLLMASGSVYQYEEKALAESGLMQVEYSAEIDGILHKFTFDVDVFTSKIGFTDENGNFYEAGTKPYEKYEMSGVLLDDALTRTYTFSKVLDLSEMNTDVPLVVLSNGGEGDVVPHIRLVDIYNPTNYIEIYGRYSLGTNEAVYSVANAPRQSQVGHMDGQLYTGSSWGTLTVFPFRSFANKDLPGKYYYDANEKAVYSDWFGTKQLISDFDADYQLNAWSGFTTGEVYLQILRRNDKDYVCVESVCGISLTDYAVDTLAPSLTVDVDESNIPYAIVKRKYPLFNVSAVDVMDGKLEVETHIYKGSDANSGVELSITDGCFVPYGPGYYTVVYSATDCSGNTTEKRINIKAVSETDVAAITATIEGIPTDAFVGEKLQLPKAENVVGGSGEVSYSVRMRAADGTVTEIQDSYVILPAEGTNTIEYIFKDYIGKESVLSFPITCTVSDSPILYELAMPQYLQSGTEFTLPAAEYAEDPTVEVSVSATMDGVDVPVQDNVITPVTNQTKAELVVTYQAKSATGTTTKSYTILVFSGDIADRTTYFYTESGTLEKIQESNAIRFNTSESNSGFRFISSVLAEKMNLVMSVDPQKNDSDRITVTLTDAFYPEISVQIDIVKKPDGDDMSKSVVFINGVQANDMVGNFYGGVASLSISYQKNAQALIDAEGNTLGKITNNLAGNAFSGFPSNLIYISVKAGNVGSKGFSWNVVQINNQVFTDDNLFFDNYPEIAVAGNLTLQTELGSEIVIPAAYSADVLSPKVALSLTVRKGANPIVENQPVNQEYSIKLEEYGKYSIVYEYAVDDLSRSVAYPVQIVENTIPQIQMPSLPSKAALNSTVKLEKPAATDDYSMINTVTILVQKPNYTMVRIDAEQMSFVADRVGNYTIFYYVYDECHNYQVIRHTITVE